MPNTYCSLVKNERELFLYLARESRGTFHVHPKGDPKNGVRFHDEPGPSDLRNSNTRHARGITGNHFVLAVGNNTVYVYHKGKVLATFPLNQFISTKTK